MNRVEDRWFDQLSRSGHYGRVEEDIDRLADLGIRALRYPVLWERHVGEDDRAWKLTDRALLRMQARGIEPILGLVHHGSGPAGTRIDEATFADGLAAHATRVAARYPWVRRYTPINEPLTTARFALLYRLWYPHYGDDAAFIRGMLVQTEATRRAMAAIRLIRDDAELVQTEDLGYSHSTEPLRYQGEFENERRWLTVDLLMGRVMRGHPLWRYLGRLRGAQDMARRFAAAPCPPDIIGCNHYITSERFLDHRLRRYPSHTHGGNGRHRYADVEAIRVLHDGVMGPRRLLRDAWRRYGLPLAITEAHLGCSREQQLAWLADLVHAAHSSWEEGVDVRAVTAWAALGSFDWPSLLTREDGVYESGLFDVRAESPRPTALASMVKALASGASYDHPVLDSPGWWHCDRRLIFRGADETARPLPIVLARGTPRDVAASAMHDASTIDAPLPKSPQRRTAGPRRILVTGCSGTLGRAIVEACAERQLACFALPRGALDITDSKRVADVLDEVRPWAVINAAGYVRVDDAERDRERCRWTNTIGPAVLADRCVTRDIALVTFSSDLVFDGAKDAPYVESDPVAPLNTYGQSKAESERLVAEIMPRALIVRTSAFFGPGDDYNFLARSLAALAMGRRVRAANDQRVSPTFVPDLVNAMLDLLIDGASGTWHLANGGAMTWSEFAIAAARSARIDSGRVQGTSSAELAYPAPRPLQSVLSSERGPDLLPSLESAIARYARTRAWERLVRRGRSHVEGRPPASVEPLETVTPAPAPAD